jgi:hypothetical protein
VFAHKINKSRKSLLEIGQTDVRFDKSDGPISSAPMAVRDIIGSDEGVLLSVKWHLTKGRNKIHDNSRSCGGG